MSYMTLQTIVSFDPGLVTGMAEGAFSETMPLSLHQAAAIPYEELREGWPFLLEVNFDHVVSEVFVSRTDNQFVPDLTGVRVEGMLDLAYHGEVVWRDRTKKAQVSDDLLREHGLWQTGSDVDWEDGRDANDAIIHMLGYVAFDLAHLPTLRKYFR